MYNQNKARNLLIGTLLVAVAAVQASCGGDVQARTSGQRKADARKMVESVLNRWDWMTWNQLLDENVELSLNLASVGAESAVGIQETILGRDAAKAALREFYGELEKNVSFWGEIAEQYQVALLGNLRVSKAAQTAGDSSGEIPFLAYLRFNEGGKVTHMTLATVDLRPLRDALKAMQGGTEEPR